MNNTLRKSTCLFPIIFSYLLTCAQGIAGVLGGDRKTIDGLWFQGSGSFPLMVTKTSDTATVKQQLRPQPPKPPSF
ncbi:MAG TPA: hypothetical protein VNS58_14190 [Puia sp.]|nr:hypothetical protein [Puia sp.]